MEEWKIAIENYEISNFGNCRRKLKNGTYKIIKGSLLTSRECKTYKTRYFQINRDNKRINYLFHVLVAKCFIGERPEGLVIDHIDRNPLNNHYTNLRYITQKENCYNSDRVIDIPIDIPNRKKIVQQLWINDNKEHIKKTRQLYTEKIKGTEKSRTEKRKKDRVIFTCSNCNKNFDIQKRSLEMKKGTMCKICNSLNNLPKSNN
jgi:hypothetical protein